jgi:hypothetical protein
LEGTGLPLSLTSPKKNTKKSARATQSKYRRQYEAELRQIAVNISKYNQIAVVNFLFHKVQTASPSHIRADACLSLPWIRRQSPFGPFGFKRAAVRPICRARFPATHVFFSAKRACHPHYNMGY